MADNDIRKEAYAPWLEGMLQHISEFKPVRMAVVLIDEEGSISRHYYKGRPTIIAQMAGIMNQDSMRMWIEQNSEWLRSVLEGNDEDESQDGEALE